jgi:hypothetical protein
MLHFLVNEDQQPNENDGIEGEVILMCSHIMEKGLSMNELVISSCCKNQYNDPAYKSQISSCKSRNKRHITCSNIQSGGMKVVPQEVQLECLLIFFGIVPDNFF